MADRKISDLTALTAPASGDYLPIVDISEAAAASKNKRITIEELFRGVPTGTAAAPSIAIEGDEDTGVYSPGANQLAISTNGTGRITIDGSGNVNIDSNTLYVDATNNRVGVGTTSPSQRLHVAGSNGSGNTTIGCYGGSSAGDYGLLTLGTGSTDKASINVDATPNDMRLDLRGNTGAFTFVSGASYTERARIDASGSFIVKGAGTAGVTQAVSFNGSAPVNSMVLDSSGRLGIGTSSVSDQLEIANGTTDAANAVGIRSGRYLNAGQEGAQLKFYSDNTSSWLGTREMARIGTYGQSSDHRIGSLAFFLKTTNSASNPSEMMRLTPTGLGIGTTSPGSNLDVRFGTNPSVDNGGGADALRVWTSSALAADAGGAVSFGGVATSGGGFGSWAQIAGRKENATSGAYGGYLQFAVNTGSGTMSERMRITSEGNIGFGSYSITRKLWVAGGTNAVVTHLDSANAQDTTWYHLYCTSSTDTVLQSWIRGDGTYGSRPNVYGGTSDIKLKENITPAQSQWNDVKNIEVVNFNFIGDDQRLVGVVAQQVETVSPGLVDESVDRDKNDNDLGTTTKSVKYSVLYMKAVKALQEAMERIEQLEAKVVALESKP